MSSQEGVAAVERALSILEVFSDYQASFTLAELSRRTGLYKSTVLRLSKSLEKYGYLARMQDGGYVLASKVFQLGSMYQRHFQTATVVPPVLKEIARKLNEGASFYVQDGNQRICLHRVDASRSVRDSVHQGDRLPLTVGAAGHVIRAFTGAVGERYDRIRIQKYDASFGERDPEVAAVASPVFGVNQAFMGALALSGPRYRIEAIGVDPIVKVLLEHARELTSILGGDPELLKVPAPQAVRTRKKMARAR